MSTLRSKTELGMGQGSKLRRRSKESGGPSYVKPPKDPSEQMLMPLLNQYKTLHNLPKEQMKSPQLRKILRKYQQNHLQTSEASILDSNFMQETSQLSNLLDAGGSLKEMVQLQMRKEYKKHVVSKKIKRQMDNEIKKPYMSEKSRHRFQVFKEQIRSELNNNEDYMFS